MTLPRRAQHAMDMKWPATQPDQICCVEHKRRVIERKHSQWMAQRSAVIGAVSPVVFEGPKHAEVVAAGKAIDAYEAEKVELAKLPPERRREAMAKKREAWLAQQQVERQSLEAAAREGAAIAAARADVASTQRPLAVSNGPADSPGRLSGVKSELWAGSVEGQSSAMHRLAASSQELEVAEGPEDASGLPALRRAKPSVLPEVSIHMTGCSQPQFSAVEVGKASAPLTALARWACSACTFENEHSAARCAMCDHAPLVATCAIGEGDQVLTSSKNLDEDFDPEDSELDEINGFLAAVELQISSGGLDP